MKPWIVGMCLNLVGSTTINFGTNMMKYSHIVEEREKEREKPPSATCRSIWYFGFLLFVIGNGLNFLSFGYAAQSLLAAMGSVQFLSNVFFASWLLNERVTNRVLEGTSAVFVGNTFVLIFANHESQNYSIDEIESMFTNMNFIIYLLFLFTLVVTISLFYSRLTSKNANNALPSAQHYLAPLCYAAISGMIGSLSVLLAKATSQLVRTTTSGENQFQYNFAYYMLFGWILLMVYWMQRLNNGLRMFPSMVIVPALQVFWTVFSIIGGGVFFNEFSNFTRSQSFGFVTGVVIIVCGVYHISSNHDETHHSKEVLDNLKNEMAHISSRSFDDPSEPDALERSNPRPASLVGWIGDNADDARTLDSRSRLPSSTGLAVLDSK